MILLLLAVFGRLISYQRVSFHQSHSLSWEYCQWTNQSLQPLCWGQMPCHSRQRSQTAQKCSFCVQSSFELPGEQVEGMWVGGQHELSPDISGPGLGLVL